MNKYLVFLFFLVLFSSETYSQQVIINGKEGERPLTWSDFTGTPGGNEKYLANTSWKIDYVFSGIGEDNDSLAINGLKVTLKLDSNKSWVKEGMATDELLKHEQGHFDIGRLCQLEVLANIKTTRFKKDEYKAQLKNIFRNNIEKYRAMGKKYDEETNHSINREKQEEWNIFLKNEKTRMLEPGK